jgi:Tfp pilus assembly protein PilN
MRPVNLIPTEDRPGSRRPLRGGPTAYLIVAALALALIGVSVLVVTDNQISDSKAEISELETEKASVEAKAQELAPYVQFHSVREQRDATVASLADSRFDWERVMRELALVLPGDVWLTNLTGTASPEVTPDGAASVALRVNIPGPALTLIGCARDQNAVAGFVQALKEIDGVTRVGVQSSVTGSSEGGASESSTAGSSCQTRDFIAQFQIAVAFDAAPLPPPAGTSEEVVPVPEEASGESESGPESEGEG